MDYGKSRRRHKAVIFFLICFILPSMFISFNLCFSVVASGSKNVTIYCYNETTPSQEIDFDVFMTNLSGSQTFDNTSYNNPAVINYSDINPKDCFVKIKITNNSYSPRTMTVFLDPTTNRTMIYYLPYFNSTELYYVKIIDFLDDPMEDVMINMSKFINGSFQLIDSKYSDAYGMASFYLIPSDEYQVSITKYGFHSKTETFTADPTDFGYNFPRYLRMRMSNVIPIDTEELFTNITWSLEPNERYFNGSFFVYYNVSSSSSDLISSRFRVSIYNTTNSTYDLLYMNTSYDSTNSSFSYNISNVTGKYKVQAFFTKTGFPEVEVNEEGSRYYFVSWGGLYFSDLFSKIPGWIIFVIILIAAAIITAFVFPYAGLGAGFVGLGVIAFGLTFTKDLVVGGVGGWAILTITTLVYTIGILLWSRI